MKVTQDTIVLSATDLANHLSCRHLTTLDLRLAKGDIAEPSWSNPDLIVLQERGREHEARYIESLRARQLSITDLSGKSEEDATRATLAAMKAGAQVIVQPSFAEPGWKGRGDVLLRVDHDQKRSHFGTWSYEVVDCKLARQTKAETILQLCLYSNLVAQMQGFEPDLLHVIRPGTDFKPESFRYASFAAYFRTIKKALRKAVGSENQETYPEPSDHCDVCRWWKHCDDQRRRDDHLSFVAGASTLQRKELAGHGISRLESLAKLSLPIPFKPTRGARDGYSRIRDQARVQLETRIIGKPRFELLEISEGNGLARLPSPSSGDVFLDFEGDPFVEEGGREYLFGVLIAGSGTQLKYEPRWALSRSEERLAFEWLIDLLFERLGRFPGMHVYHFGSYEVAAIKRIMLRYATREEEVDRLLRGETFVDLHMVVKQALRAGVERYSLKDLEQFFEYKRIVPLPRANEARHRIEHQLELAHALKLPDECSSTVEGYNQDDCRATERLRKWLESLRAELISKGKDLPRPAPKDTSQSEEVTAHQQRVSVLFKALTHDLPLEPNARTSEQNAHWLLAHALDWHRREEKVKWWEFFRMKDLSEEELYDEKTAVAGLTHVCRLPKASPREKAPTDRYQYPPQECAVKQGDTLYTLDEQRFGEVVGEDASARTFDVKKPLKLDQVHPDCTFAYKSYRTTEQSESMLRLGDWIVANGIDGPGDYRSARDLLLKTPPRLSGGEALRRLPHETVVEGACRIGLALDSSVLAIQGPPGSGKTFTGARMICELVKNGKKIGITAVSHKVIRNLLNEVLNAASEMKISDVRCGHRKDGGDPSDTPVSEFATNEEALESLENGTVNVLGGTPWLWCRSEFASSLHCLFVDEAGQLSLANVLACAPAGKNLVLLGDPQQLEQPQKGSHPEGSDISALSHLLNGQKTIGDDQGLFLDKTRRLHPSICAFTSELFYDGRLLALDSLEKQRLSGPEPFNGTGLWFVPIAHTGNQTFAPEEIERVAELIDSLTNRGATWTNDEGLTQKLLLRDVLIVAPYNDQVNRIADRIPFARVGTVDKFQGQQAAVVIYSLTTSAPEDAPRGMEFLYNLNRFNVASSRARCACIVVGSPALLSPDCRTPRQMQLANVLCRYYEMSRIVRPECGGSVPE